MVAVRLTALALAIATLASASPCPFGQLAEAGKLSADETAKFFKVRSEGGAAVEEIIEEQAAVKQKREFDIQRDIYEDMQKRQLLPLGGGLLNGVLQPFSGALQKLDIPTPQATGLAIIPDAAHPYQFPKKTAVRGMCPTLNTMANHGYINRNGITTFAQAANACQITLGFGYDTCVFLSALGLLSGGDLPTGIYSIGGADSRVPNTIGKAPGISFHGPFEIDQSISRIDTYFGNQANFNLARMNALTKDAEANGGQYNFAAFNAERQRTYTASRNTNPNFDAGPKQLAVSLAERVFIFRAMPNGTAEGLANKANVLPFYLNETFPDNWFRRATAYNLPNVGTDVVTLYALGPTQVGANNGLNNFIPTGLDFGKLTPTEATCFLLQELLDFQPGEVSSLVGPNFGLYKAFLNGAVVPFFSGLGCNVNFKSPGPNACKGCKAGVSTTQNTLINGHYVNPGPGTPVPPPKE